MFSPVTKWVITAKVACRGIAAGMVLLTLAGVAHASPILTLFNTGVFANGLLEPNGTLGDPHYTLVTVPLTGTTVLRAVTSAGAFPVPPWLADDAVSRWIAPNDGAPGPLNSPEGTYDYRTTFDLTGFVPASASITGRWATDNAGVNILLNGAATGQTSGSFATFTAFALVSGFSSGINTLDFIVANASGTTGNPTGLRVELTGTATAIPEPSSFLLFGAGLAGLGMMARRRLRAATSGR